MNIIINLEGVRYCLTKLLSL